MTKPRHPLQSGPDMAKGRHVRILAEHMYQVQNLDGLRFPFISSDVVFRVLAFCLFRKKNDSELILNV